MSYTKRELPIILNREKPVVSSTQLEFKDYFSGQASRPPTEKIFSISNNRASMPFAILLAILAFMWLGRR